VLRNSIFKLTNDDLIHIPVNASKIITNAKREFEINHKSKSDLNPVYVIERVKATLDDLCTIPSIKNRDSPLLREANENSTSLMKMYLRQVLSAKHLIFKERLDQSSFEYVLGEVKTKFEQSLVHPGEMIGSIAA
jgi:DNA-directed RNA polymerase II subunit RPB1